MTGFSERMSRHVREEAVESIAPSLKLKININPTYRASPPNPTSSLSFASGFSVFLGRSFESPSHRRRK